MGLIRSMKNPPDGVKVVVAAAECVMKDIKPEKIPDPSGTGRMVFDYWKSSLKMLSDPEFLENLKLFDKDDIPAHVIKKIHNAYVLQFKPETVYNASSATESFCNCTITMESYDRVANQATALAGLFREAVGPVPQRRPSALTLKKEKLERDLDGILHNLAGDVQPASSPTSAPSRRRTADCVADRIVAARAAGIPCSDSFSILDTVPQKHADLSSNILENETAIEVLSSSNILSAELFEKQKVAEETERKIDETRDSCRPIVSHSSVLFFCISGLVNVESMNQHSLNWFIDLFVVGIANLEACFTYSLYCNICRSLFEKDKLPCSFLLCACILRSRSELDLQEFAFFTFGAVGFAAAVDPNPILTRRGGRFPRPPTRGRRRCPAAGATGSAATSPTEFQRLLLVRVLRAEKTVPAVQEFVKAKLGPKFIEPPTFDLASSFEDSSSRTPLIFILSPGMDPMAQLLKFADDKGFGGQKCQSISQGQGQGPIAAAMIKEAQTAGSWLAAGAGKDHRRHAAASASVHKDFRLWLTSYLSDRFPASILQHGVKLINELPKGIKANLLKSFVSDTVADENFFGGCSKPLEWEKLLFGLCMFHAVVQFADTKNMPGSIQKTQEQSAAGGVGGCRPKSSDMIVVEVATNILARIPNTFSIEANSIPIGELGLEYEITLHRTASDTVVAPDDRVPVTGLFLEGACWSQDSHSVAESASKALYDLLPIIWFRPSRQQQQAGYSGGGWRNNLRSGLSTTGQHPPTPTPPALTAMEGSDTAAKAAGKKHRVAGPAAPAPGALTANGAALPSPPSSASAAAAAASGNGTADLGGPDYLRVILTVNVYDVAIESPLQKAVNLSGRLGNTVLLKREDLHPVFSVKLRGAYNRMQQLSDAERRAGVIACSARNNVQGVVLAPERMNIQATIVMRLATPPIKWRNAKRLGATVVLQSADFDEAKKECALLAALWGLANIPPYDDPYVIAGQGTISVVILPRPLRRHCYILRRRSGRRQRQRATVSGGNLAAGVAAYVKRVRPAVGIVGIETYVGNDALAVGRLAEVGLLADGAAVRSVGVKAFRVRFELVDQMALVGTDEIGQLYGR
ncbi:Dynein heavy chain 7, axonemal, partial [Cladochytrium tenue]